LTLLHHRVGTERRRRAALAGSAQRPLQIPGLPELTEFGAHRGFDPSERTMLHQALGSGSDLGRGDRIADKPANETRANLGRTPRWQGFEQATLNHVGQGSGSYTTRDFEELLRYAQARHIEVIPEFDFPAHARAQCRRWSAAISV